MVLNYICLGKGVIVPYKVLVEKYSSELVTIYPDFEFEGDYNDDGEKLEEVIQKELGSEYDIVLLGHDAFKSGHYPIVSALEDNETYSKIQEWFKENKTELIFIGKYKTLHGVEMNTCPGTSELLYSLTGLLPKIFEYYPKLLQEDLSLLETHFNQKSQIWTFGTDCACCS